MSTKPILEAKIHRDFVDVCIEGKERSVPVPDFVSLMSKHIGFFSDTSSDSSGNKVLQVPKSFVGAVEYDSGKKKRVFLYKESHRSDLLLDIGRTRIGDLLEQIVGSKKFRDEGFLSKGNDSGIEFSEGGRGVMKIKDCVLPNFVACINLDLNLSDKKNYAVTSVRYGFTAIPREMLRPLTKDSNTVDSMCQTLGHMPFPNFYSGNTMCYGANQTVATISATEENYRPLESYLSLISSSPFNTDLWEGLPDLVYREVMGKEYRDLFIRTVAGVDSPKEEKIESIIDDWGSTYRLVNWFTYLSKAKEFPYHLFHRG